MRTTLAGVNSHDATSALIPMILFFFSRSIEGWRLPIGGIGCKIWKQSRALTSQEWFFHIDQTPSAVFENHWLFSFEHSTCFFCWQAKWSYQPGRGVFFFGGLKCRRETWWDMVTYDVTSHDVFFSQNGWFRIGGMLKKHYFYLLEIGSCCFRDYVYIISARVLSFFTIVFFSSFCSILRKLFCAERRIIIESRWKWKMGCLQYSCPLFGVIFHFHDYGRKGW